MFFKINIIIIFINNYIFKPENKLKNKELNKRKYTIINNEEENPKIDFISKKMFYKTSLQKRNIEESINANLTEINSVEIASNSSYSITQDSLSRIEYNINKKSSINNFITNLSEKITNIKSTTEDISLSNINYKTPDIEEITQSNIENTELVIKENDIEILPVDNTNINLEEMSLNKKLKVDSLKNKELNNERFKLQKLKPINNKLNENKEDFIKLFIKEVDEEFPIKLIDSNYDNNVIIDNKNSSVIKFPENLTTNEITINETNIIKKPLLPIVNNTKLIINPFENIENNNIITQDDCSNFSIIVTNTKSNTPIENITPISNDCIIYNHIIPEEQSLENQIINSEDITNYNKLIGESSSANNSTLLESNISENKEIFYLSSNIEELVEINSTNNNTTINESNNNHIESPYLELNHIENIDSLKPDNNILQDNISNSIIKDTNKEENNSNRYNNFNILNTKSRKNIILNNHFNMLAPFSLNTAYKPQIYLTNIEISATTLNNNEIKINHKLKEIFYDEKPCLDIYFLTNESLRLTYVYNIKRLEKWCVPEFYVDYYTSQCTCESSDMFIHLTYFFKGIPLYLYPKLSLNQNIRIWSIQRIYNNYMFNFLVHICINKNILETDESIWNFFDIMDNEKNYLNLFIIRLKNLSITILKKNPKKKIIIEDSSISQEPFSIKRNYITLEDFLEIRYDKMIKEIESLLLSLSTKEERNILETEKELKYFIEIMFQQTTIFYKNYKILLNKICNKEEDNTNIFLFIKKLLEDINIFALPSYLRKNFSNEELELISFCYSLKTRIRSFIRLNIPYINY